MHPLVARIHPSYRTALTAWLVSHTLLWMTAAAAGHPLLPVLDASGGGAPGWALTIRAASLLGLWGPPALAAAGELAMLLAAVGVYQFVRRDQLPQTAERATWLWAMCPAVVWTVPAADWTFAVALVAIGLGLVSSSRHIGAAVAMAAAVTFKPEALLVWPGLAVVGWKKYRPGKQHRTSPWVTTLGPPAAFTAVIVVAMSMAGRRGISLRTLQSGRQWRDHLPGLDVWSHAPDFLVAGALLAGIGLAVAYLDKVPNTWPLIALPCVIWPCLHQSPTAAVAAILFAAPTFGGLGRITTSPSVERPLMAASLGGLLVLAIF